MCGINGFNFKDQDLLQAMNGAIRHRGPDDAGQYLSSDVSLGHTRLSIIDLSTAGHQPMEYTHESKKIVVVFNGEIYNYQEIRKDLQGRGFSFSSSSDTEVLAAAYCAYGEECVQKFNGMWSFCIYDLEKEILFCSRDRFGKKPFYYYFHEGKFIFSSELKAILEHKSLNINTESNINPEAVDLYFSLGFIPAPLSIYCNVFKLEARHNLVFDLTTRSLKTYQYYFLPSYQPCYDRKKLVAEGRKILADAVKIRMRSDVPVGAFLSGGLDSSTVVGMMKNYTDISKLHTFSIGFDGKYDETPYINIVKDHFKTEHHHEYFCEEDFEKLLDQYIFCYDEPFGDFGGFPTLKVSQLAKEKVTVVLTGDGGDEIFGGYTSYINLAQLLFVEKIPKIIRKLIRKFLGIFSFEPLSLCGKVKELFSWSLRYSSNSVLMDLYPGNRFWTAQGVVFYKDKMNSCLQLSNNNLCEAVRIYDLLFGTLSDNFLVKTDRGTMMYGIEARNPLLDYRLAEFSQRIPTDYKVDYFGGSKKLMREITKDYLPDILIKKKNKQGFTPPFREYLFSQKNHEELFDSLEKLNVSILPEEVASIVKILRITKILKEQNKDLALKAYLFTKFTQRWIRST